MKKITLVTVLTLTATALSFSTVKANTIPSTSTEVAVSATEGLAVFQFGSASALDLDFSDINFDNVTGKADALTKQLTLPAASLANRSFRERTVNVSVATAGEGLTVTSPDPAYSLKAAQGTSATKSDAKVTVSLDPAQYKHTEKDSYKVTVTATDVTPQAPDA